MIEIKQAAIRDYPGGYERWHADMTREANRQGLKSAARGTITPRKEQSTTGGQKNAADGVLERNRHMPGVPNQTEERYRDNFLVPRILSGEIVECVFEGRTFEIAHRCSYTPDWWCRLADGQEECHEVKGAHVWDDSRVKFKVAARLNPEVKFVLARWWKETWKISVVPK